MKTSCLEGHPSRLHSVFFRCRYFAVIWLVLIAAARAVVNPPTLSPDSGTYTTFQTVTVACSTPDTFLCYTTDGSDPAATGTPVPPGNILLINASPTTLKVKAFLTATQEPSATKIATYIITGQVSTSGSHTLVLRADGTVWATGKNDYGQLGDGTTTSQIFLK